MSESPPVSPVPAASPPLEKSPAAPLLLWLVIQLIALSVAVFRVPLSARFQQPGEQFALHTLLVAQVLASSLLFPLLLRDARTSAMVILSIAPFAQLAAYLSSIPMTRAALAALYVATWLVALALWRRAARTRATEMLGVALALALSLGGAIIWYVRAESREPGPIDWSRDGLFGPILGALAQIHATPAAPWLAAMIVLALSAVASLRVGRREVGRSGNAREGL